MARDSAPMNPRVLLGGALAVLGFVACHSASWSPPEPQQAPSPTTAASPSEMPSTSKAEPEPAPPAPAAEATSAEPPPATSAEPSGAPTASAAATGEPASAAKPNPEAHAHQEAHKAEAPPSAADAYSGPDPCQAKTFHYSAIGGACKKGGRKAVKDIMRGIVKKAKAAGQDVQCTSCHEDTSTFHLKSNAVSDIKQWL